MHISLKFHLVESIDWRENQFTLSSTGASPKIYATRLNDRPKPSIHRNVTWKHRITPKGSEPARLSYDYAGMGGWKKRMADCNDLHKVSLT